MRNNPVPAGPFGPHDFGPAAFGAGPFTAFRPFDRETAGRGRRGGPRPSRAERASRRAMRDAFFASMSPTPPSATMSDAEDETRAADQPGDVEAPRRGRGRGPRGEGRGEGGHGPHGRGRSEFGPGFGGFGPGFGGPGFGGPGFGGPGGPFARGPKAGRGDVRAGVLALLAEQPRHGYEIITELSARSGGVWRPSPGSIYPTLKALHREGLVTAERGEGRKVFALTDAGRAYVEEHAAELDAPWDAVASEADDSALELRDLIQQVAVAVAQVAQAGTSEQQAAAATLLAETRRAVYRILAE